MSGFFAPGRHRLAVRVYYEDTDAAGIVYYANYLKFAERGRSDYMRDAGTNHAALLASDGIAFAVRRCTVDYQRPAVLDDLLTVESCIVALGAATMEFEQTIARDGQTLVTLHTRLACMATDGRPRRLPAEVRQIVEPLLCPPTFSVSQP